MHIHMLFIISCEAVGKISYLDFCVTGKLTDSKNRRGVVAGLVVLALLVILLASAILLYYVKRKREHNSSHKNSIQESTTPERSTANSATSEFAHSMVLLL